MSGPPRPSRTLRCPPRQAQRRERGEHSPNPCPPSGTLARAWGSALFAAPDPYGEVCLAAEQHDVGMAEWDLRASLNPRTGLPCSFLEIPLQTHLALWTAAPAKLLTQSRYAALLVS